MVYKWKGRFYNVDANIVGKEIEKIEKEQGAITTKSFVDAARPKNSPLHSLFEWDDKKAAENYRRQQASVIICHLGVVQEEMKEPTVVRAYMNVADNADDAVRRSGIFINMNTAFKDTEKRNLILRTAIRELQEIRRKYEALTELAEIFDKINSLEA